MSAAINSVNVSHIARYLQCMKSRGFSPSQVLSGSGISEDTLCNPKAMVDAQQYQIVVTNMLALSNNEALGVELGQEMICPEMGVLGYAMMSSPTLRRAVNLWLSYSRVLYGAFVECAVTETQHSWTLETEVFLPYGPAYRFCVEEFLMFSRQLGISLSQRSFEFARLELPFPRPSTPPLYEALFSCPIQYNSGKFIISVVSPGLDTPVTTQNLELNRTYLGFCEKIAREIGSSTPLQIKIYNEFVRHPEALPSMPQMAEKLCISERSLRRKLADEGSSYRDLLTNFRVELAKEYLQADHLSCKEIAFQLGFSDTSHFVKVFKAHTGMTPMRFAINRDYRATRQPSEGVR